MWSEYISIYVTFLNIYCIKYNSGEEMNASWRSLSQFAKTNEPIFEVQHFSVKTKYFERDFMGCRHKNIFLIQNNLMAVLH